MRDNPNLDLLRACAVALVVLSHLGLNLRWAGPGFDIEAMGRVGVGIFFVHTTLVLMLSMERSGGAALPFLVRRFFRIYPLAIVVVLIVTLLQMRWWGQIDWWAVASNLLLIQNLTGHASNPPPLWSLPYEVQMYLLLPAVFAVTQLRLAPGWILLSIVGSAAAVLAIAAAGGNGMLLQYLPCFLPGALAFVLARGRRPTISAWWPFVIVGVGAAAVPVLVRVGVAETQLLWLLSLALGLVLPASRQITWEPLAAAAKVVATHSYGVYLTHMLCLEVAFVALQGRPSLLQWGVFVLALVALPRAAYLWIEKPGIDRGARVADQLRRRIIRTAETKKTPQPEGQGA